MSEFTKTVNDPKVDCITIRDRKSRDKVQSQMGPGVTRNRQRAQYTGTGLSKDFLLAQRTSRDIELGVLFQGWPPKPSTEEARVRVIPG